MQASGEVKKCTKCGEIKELCQYHLHKLGKHGRHPSCKACIKKYISANMDMAKVRTDRWRSKNKEKVTEIARVWRSKNRNAMNANQKKYILANSDGYIGTQLKKTGVFVNKETIELKRVIMQLNKLTLCKPLTT